MIHSATLRVASISVSRGLRFSCKGNQYSRKSRLTCVDETDNDYTTFDSESSGLWTPPFIGGRIRVRNQHQNPDAMEF
ncbi:hypothetical protein PTI98_006518 [Pleurotus ostreatus]|nr:hypothetical protein PTI98_006518 [Pleurotus ostreatus]